MYDFFFAFLHFGVIAALISYVWIRFVVPLIEAMAQKQASAKEALHDEHRKLLKEHQVLDQSITQQEEECKALSLKVIKWKEVVEQEQAKRMEEEKRMYREFKRKIEERAVKLRPTLIYQRVKPYVLTHLEEELRTHFVDPETRRLYLDRLLRGL